MVKKVLWFYSGGKGMWYLASINFNIVKKYSVYWTLTHGKVKNGWHLRFIIDLKCSPEVHAS